MKVRDSGMPEQAYWESLFDVPLTIERFAFKQYRDVAEMGCGYGTFTEAVAKAISGKLFAFDIDPEMVDRTAVRTSEWKVFVAERDIISDGFGVQADAVMLFNILHCEEPERLLQIASESARRILVTHWIEEPTPRGPASNVRPTPERITYWASRCSLEVERTFSIPPWHFGMVLQGRKATLQFHNRFRGKDFTKYVPLSNLRKIESWTFSPKVENEWFRS